MVDKSLFVMRDIRAALARDRYGRNEFVIADPDIAGYHWLVASPQGVFAVSDDGAKTVIQGWFFGIHRHGDTIYLFENCGHKESATPLGRIVRLRIAGDRLEAPAVLATGLDTNCHQLAVIDDLICVVDTANQTIPRFTLEGQAVDIMRPLPAAVRSPVLSGYHHINAIALVDGRIGIMLHNGRVTPPTTSEVIWLDRDWNLVGRQAMPGHSCHDIVEDEHGVLWHCDSMAGELIGSDGTRVKISEDLMTRGIAFNRDSVIVGMSTFGPRHRRHKLRGSVLILDRDFNRRAEITLPGAPTDIIAL